MFTEPEEICSSVETIRNAVVFPAPLGPMSPKISPWLILKVIPFTASTVPKCFTRFFTSTVAMFFYPLITYYATTVNLYCV